MSQHQLSLLEESEGYKPLLLPPLHITRKHKLGQIGHVVRESSTQTIMGSEEIRVSVKKKVKLFTLSSGEKVAISKTKIIRPSEADGVLQLTKDSNYRWLSHKLIESAEAEIAKDGWKNFAKRCSSDWNGKFSFRVEMRGTDGAVSLGNEGLRPAQIGALYAIGAHWSLHSSPATIIMPTGTGKTETMLATLAQFIKGTLLVVVPSQVLRDQTVEKFRTFGLLRKVNALSYDAANPVVGILKHRPESIADLDIFDSCNVIVGTMSSLGFNDTGNMKNEISKRITNLIVDEAHHVPADTWNQFKDICVEKKVLQFTETPFRQDKKLVEGNIIFQYSLRAAQRDGYFKRITFLPVYEIDADRSDLAVAQTALARLRADIKAGYNHLLMARCSNIKRAENVHKIYQTLAPDLRPILVHSELAGADARVLALRSGQSRIVVCVNMLGEGFDLPELKVAALHDIHKSLAITLQFIGRFTRSALENLGDASAIANIADADFSAALERLYSEDADWNDLLNELSSEAAKEHAELIAFLNSSQRLDDEDNEGAIAISQQLLKPAFGTLFYEAEEFRPKAFYQGLPEGLDVRAVWVHSPSHTLFFVTVYEELLRWTRSKEILNREWDLFVIHFDPVNKLLYLSSTDHTSPFGELAAAIGAGRQISGDTIFRSLGKINRLVFQNIGVKKHGRKNLRYAMYTGADVAEALSISERAGSVKSNLTGTGWENGRPISIGCSYKGRVWSKERGPIPRFIRWCENVGNKIVDQNIDTSQIIANVLIPKEVNTFPDKNVLSIEWPVELLHQPEDRITLAAGSEEYELFLVGLETTNVDLEKNELSFSIILADGEILATLVLTVGGENGFMVARRSTNEVLLNMGRRSIPIEAFLSDYPPLVRFIDLSELDGNLLVAPETAPALSISEDRFEVWDWRAIDLQKESIWKDGEERPDSIQWRANEYFSKNGYEVIFDDDAAVEAADLICLKEEADQICLSLVHCKYSGGASAGERVKDVVEVCSQAVRSAKWRWKFRDLCKHIAGRESRLSKSNGRTTRFLAGSNSKISRILKVSRFKELRFEIYIVQPGLSKKDRTADQTYVLAAASSYLKETAAVDLKVVCSE